MKRSLLSSFIIIISALLSINILLNIWSKKDTTEETLFYTKNLQEEFAKYDHDMTNIFTGKKITVESKFNRSEKLMIYYGIIL